MDYLKIAIVQIVTLFILYYILYIPRLVCTLLQLPFQTNSTPSKIISAIFAIFQTYVIASVMILNNQIMNDFYGGNLHSAVLLIIAIFFAISNLISGTSNSRKQLLAQKEFETAELLEITFGVSLYATIPIFVILYYADFLIWTTPYLYVMRFVSWILSIKYIGAILKTILTGLSLLCIFNCIMQLIVYLSALIAKIRYRQ